jgi:flagellin-like protein
MKRKGISPLIAAVLLIAFTMAVASIFAQWAPQLIQSAQGDTTNQSDELQRCSSVNIQVVRDVSNKSSVTVQQTSGDNGVGELSATFFYESGPVSASTQTIADNEPRGTAVFSLTSGELPDGVSDFGNAVLESVEVSPTQCEGTAPASWSP